MPAGFADATVTIQVQGPPTAVDDGPAAASAPGDLFHTAFNTTLNSTNTAADDNLRANDQLGFPEAGISHFGGGDLGGSVTNNAAGSTVTPLTGETTGSLTVNADGSFSFTPPTGFTGLYTFDYRLTNSAGSSDATVTIAVGVRPAATDDSYLPTVLGNVSIDTTTSSSFSALANDSGDGLTIIAFDAASANGGDVVVNADGTFSYDPPVGYEGSDSFTYTIDNGFSDPQSGTVSLTVSGMIWFIDQSAGSGGDGRLSDPFDCLVSATCFSTVASDGGGDTIFLASGAYTGGLTLLNNQFLIGEGATASISAISGLTPPADSPSLPTTNGTRPQLTTTNADGITLGSGNTIRGLNIGNTGTGTGITGSSFGTLTLSEVAVSGTGRAVSLTTGTAAVTFGAITVTSSTSQGINLNGVNGSFTVSGAVDIDSTTNEGIRIQNATSGTTSFTGVVSTTTGAQAGVSLTTNSGHAITFSGGLDIDTTSGTGFNATGGGTVQVTGAANTVDSGTGTAVNIVSTTIGASGVTFRRVSANGATNGIVLNSTGNSGSFSVTGDTRTTLGGNGSGGTIGNSTNAGISLTSTLNPAFRNMTIEDTGFHGIYGPSGVNGFTLQYSTVQRAGNGNDEHGIHLVNVVGTVLIDSDLLTQSANDLVQILNTGSNATVTVSNSALLETDGSGGLFGNDAISLQVQGSSVVTLNVNNNAFGQAANGLFGNAVDIGNSTGGAVLATGVVNFNASGNTSTQNAADLNKSGSFKVSGQDSLTVNLDLTGNTFTGAKGNGVISVDANDSSTVQGHIGRSGVGNGNTIANATNSNGIVVLGDESANVIVIVENNGLTSIGTDGIQVANFGSTLGDPTAMDVTLRGNSVNGHNGGAAPFFAGIDIFGGGAAGGHLCINMANNNVTGTPGGFFDYSLDDFGAPSAMLVQGPGNAAVTVADIQSLNSQPAATVSLFGAINFSNGAACLTPP